MSRDRAIERAVRGFDDGGFMRDLARRVAYHTESQVKESRPHLTTYLTEEIGPTLQAMGYETKLFDNPIAAGGPFMVGTRIEDAALPTVLTYGHGDVIRGLPKASAACRACCRAWRRAVP